MDFGFDLLVNPQKVKPYVKTKDIGKKQQNIELLGKQQKPDLVIDMIEDDIVEQFPNMKKEFLFPKKNIPKPPLSPPKFININPSAPNFDLTKLH